MKPQKTKMSEMKAQKAKNDGPKPQIFEKEKLQILKGKLQSFGAGVTRGDKVGQRPEPRSICEHVCMYLFMYAYVYVCRYVGPYVCMYVCLYVCMYVCMSMYVNVCMYVCMHAKRMYACEKDVFMFLL